MSDAELEKLRRVSIPDLLLEWGYTVDPNKSTKRYAIFRRVGEVLVVRADRNGGWSYFSSTDPADRGGVIQLVQRRQQLNLGQVRRFLRSRAVGTPCLPTERRDEGFSPDAWWRARPVRDRSEYLEERGITPHTIGRYAGEMRLGSRGALMVRHGDASRRLVGFEIRTRVAKRFSRGGRRGLALFGDSQAAHRLCLTESAVDALSWAQLDGVRRDTLFASTAGCISALAGAVIVGLVRQGINQVVLGFDRDPAGEQLRRRALSLLGGYDVSITVAALPAACKDWNDAVQQQREVSSYQSNRGGSGGGRENVYHSALEKESPQ